MILDDGRLSDRSGPALSAEQIFVGGQLSCSGHFAAVGPLLLARARVTGPVAFGGRLESDHGDAIDAAGLKAESHVTFRASCAAEGRVVLLGASVGGNLRFIGGRLVNPHAVALSAAGAHVHGDLVVRDGLQVRGQLELTEATIGGQLLLGKAAVSDGPDPVVALDGATIDGAVFFDDGLLVRGHVAMRFAKVNGPVYVRSARVLNPGAVAISLDGLRAQGHVRLGPDLDVVGEIRGVRSSIAGQLNVTAILRNPHHLSMHFDGAQLGAHVRFAGVRSEGEIRLLGAHISGQFAIDDLCASKPQRACLSADRLTVDGDVYLSNITAAGEVRFPGARMLGQAMFSQVNIESNTETALSLRAATVDGDLGVGSARLGKGRLDLTDAAVGGELLDTDITWRGSYELEQLRYTRIDARNKLPVKKRKGRFWEDPIARRRLTWLTKNASGYHPQLYDQLARTYRSAGHDTRARRVLIQKERERRRSFGIPGRAWSLMQDLLLGYGYRTWLVLFPFVLLAGLGFAYFDAHRSLIVQLDPTHHPPPFRPLLYTLDLLLPVVTLGQRDNYSARHGAETMSAVLVICGWILTTAIVAGLAALVRRER